MDLSDADIEQLRRSLYGCKDRHGRLWFLNNDTRTHNIRVVDAKLDFGSSAQEPSETVEIAFPKVGSYPVFCGIHPKMELTVDVTR